MSGKVVQNIAGAAHDVAQGLSCPVCQERGSLAALGLDMDKMREGLGEMGLHYV